jgi:hypothetical protein
VGNPCLGIIKDAVMNEQWWYIHNMRNRGNAIPTRLAQKLSGIKPTTELTLRQAGNLSGGICHYSKKNFEEEP